MRVVDIRTGELRSTLHLGALLAVLVAGHTVTETARDTLFLSKLPPERLTFVYALIAVGSLVAAAAASALAARFGRRTALVLSLLGCAGFVGTMFLCPMTPLTVFVLYLGSGIVGTVLAVQFWTLAGPLFTVAQGKRLFGPIAAGGGLGAAAGGGGAAIALQVLPTVALLPIAGVMFAAAAALAAGVGGGEASEAGAARRPFSTSGGSAPRHPPPGFPAAALRATASWARDLSALGRDRFLVLVAIMTSLGTAAALVADYLFKSTAARELGAPALGSFFATFYAVQNGLGLLAQVLLSGFLIRRLGVPGALLVLPLCLATFGVWGTIAGGAGALAAYAAKGADGSLRHSVHRVAGELVLLPVRADLRDRAKPILDAVFGRGVQALTAAGVLGLAALELGGSRPLAVVLLLLALAWLAAAASIKAPYVDLFRRALARGELPGGAADDLDVASIEAIMEALASQDEDVVLAAIDVLQESGRARVLPALILYHRSPRVLERALAVVASPARRDWIPLARQLVDHDDASVRASAVRALAAIADEAAVARGLEDRDDRVRACAAFFSAARTAADDPDRDRHIEEILRRDGGAKVRAALLEVIADFGDPAWRPVVEAIVERDRELPAMAPAAAAAIQKTGDERFLPYLISRLDVRDGRAVIRDAIASLGVEGFAGLCQALGDQRTPPRVRWEIPKAIASFRTQTSVDWLTARLGVEPSGTVRFRILRALERLRAAAVESGGRRLKFDRAAFEREAHKNLIEHLRMAGLTAALGRTDSDARAEGTAAGRVLYHLLCDKRRQSLDRAFRVLQLAHPHEDLGSVHLALTRGDKRARANALEMVGMLSIASRVTREILSLVADDLPPAEMISRARGLLASSPEESRAVAPADYEHAIELLLHDRDDVIAALAAHHALDSGVIALAREARGALEERPALGRLGAGSIPSTTGQAHAR